MGRVGASDCLRTDLVCAFIDEHYHRRARHTRGRSTPYVNNNPLTKEARIQLHRWRQGDLRATIWALDEFLTSNNLHLSDFFTWCEQAVVCDDCGKPWSLTECCGSPVTGISPWLLGNAPDWHEENWEFEDANWIDPLATIEVAAAA